MQLHNAILLIALAVAVGFAAGVFLSWLAVRDKLAASRDADERRRVDEWRGRPTHGPRYSGVN